MSGFNSIDNEWINKLLLIDFIVLKCRQEVQMNALLLA